MQGHERGAQWRPQGSSWKPWEGDQALISTCSFPVFTNGAFLLQGCLHVGAATTVAQMVQALGEVSKSGDPKAAPISKAAAAHCAALRGLLLRVSGTHVRNAATVGGNLVLARWVLPGTCTPHGMVRRGGV